MPRFDDNTRDEILTQTSRLVAATAKAVSELIANEQLNSSPLGGEAYPPTPRQRADELRLKADALLELLPKDTNSPAQPIRTGFQREVKS